MSTTQQQVSPGIAVHEPLEDDSEIPYLPEVREIVRNLSIAEKHHRLYPVHSKVVQDSLDTFVKSVQVYLEASASALQFHVSKHSLHFGDVEVYHEEQLANSVAGRLHKDGVRGVVFLEDLKHEEAASFLLCFREILDVDEDEADFGTLFWEKDCTNVQLQLVDDAEECDEESIDLPSGHLFALGFDPQKFSLREGEEERLLEELGTKRGKAEKSDSAFQLTEAEIESIRELVESEETYFAIFDFIDILLEHIARSDREKGLEDAARLIRDVVLALIENLDFDHAALVLAKVSKDPHPALNDRQMKRIREIVGDFTDKKTMQALADFLRENPKLEKNHAVFGFMRLLGREAIPTFCQFMQHHEHIPQLSDVLIEIGKSRGEFFAKQLMDADSKVAQALIHVILNTDKKGAALRRIAAALRHQNEAVRKYAAKVILDHGDREIGSFFVPLLDDPPLFPVALQFYAKVPFPAAFDPLTKVIFGRLFYNMDQQRQIVCFKAWILSNPDRALELIETKILNWRRSLTQQSHQRKAAAIRGLVYHPGEEARDFILELSEHKRSPLAEIAEQALRMRDELERRPNREERLRKASVAPRGES